MTSTLGSIASSAVAVPTPFRDNRIDTEALARLCERHVERATSAIFVCGSTGEAASLNPAERAQALGAAVEAAAGRLQIIAGCTSTATEVAVALAAAAARRCGRATLRSSAVF
jgi:4-hydroxy-tetrahydrodipicolinate synthase